MVVRKPWPVDTDVFDAAGIEALMERFGGCWWR
jgi:hypothetical protein